MTVMKSCVIAVCVALAVAGCGGSKNASPASSSPMTHAAPPVATTTPARTATPSPAPLQAEARAAATGDIPDNQVFLHFTDLVAGYSMKYPEGWAQQGSGLTVTFRDKNNIVRVLVKKPGVAMTLAQATRDLAGVAGATITAEPRSITVGGKPAVKVVYATQSAANPVTGKRVVLVVDRYYLSHAGARAVVDLGTPRGVDNVDAYRLMIESFVWK